VIPSKCRMTSCFCIVTVSHFTYHTLGIVVLPSYNREIAGGIRAYYCICVFFARDILSVQFTQLTYVFYCQLTRAAYKTLLQVFISTSSNTVDVSVILGHIYYLKTFYDLHKYARI